MATAIAPEAHLTERAARRGITIVPSPPTIGAEITGIDLDRNRLDPQS